MLKSINYFYLFFEYYSTLIPLHFSTFLARFLGKGDGSVNNLFFFNLII